ncbi:uncharacterized protein LOC113272531 [Papaver somniferum]|uniref:uncharacterized protein LOC113272531 n=1 Tax=Papaver somniferum TaxID=3469 RepID=UPI000E6F5950|nr:uncharacterized protein LOC113272531 [Papaver somniferum]
MTKTFLKNIIKDDIRVSTKQKSAADIQDLFFREYQVDLSYHQAYHGLKYCKEYIWGDDIKLYSDFLWYEEAVKHYNPGNVINFQFNAQTDSLRDAMFLTGKFMGGLMVACGENGNQEIFPVAFGIVCSENSDNWRWLLESLKGIVDVDRPLTIIYDRGTGLLNTVPEIFPNSFHSYCSYHMKGNIPVSKGRSRQTDIKLFEQCYSVVTKEQFLKAVSSMVNMKLFSVIEWMKKIPLKNWAAHEFLGRYGELTSNVVESFNSFLRHEKQLKVIELIECIRARTMETMWKRKLASSKWTAILTPKMQARLDKRITDCRRYKVRRDSEKVFEIITNTGKHTVDLDSRTCTCQWWKKHSSPCSHSVKAMVQIGEEEVYNHITSYYIVEYYKGMYAKPIYPIPDEDKPDEISLTKYVIPPPVGPHVGRPNSVRKHSYREKFRKKRNCGHCGMLVYHNRRTCRSAPLAPSPPIFKDQPRIGRFYRMMFL